MLFKKYRSVPVSTTAGNPDWQKLTVAKGKLVQWVIFFDPEAANMLHVRVEYHGHQIMPFSGSEWVVAFLQPITLGENILIEDAPYELDIFAYNTSTANEHEYYLHANIEPEKPLAVSEVSEEWWSQIKGLVGSE